MGSNMDKIYIVMDYVEHDLKSLMAPETMKQPFLVGKIFLYVLCDQRYKEKLIQSIIFY